ncbi:MAG: hypothetical protein E7609_07470 [Ruminococcaceae bacterium]|nr:hypothetical protein [Oscillospiraceae bacterium]
MKKFLSLLLFTALLLSSLSLCACKDNEGEDGDGSTLFYKTCDVCGEEKLNCKNDTRLYGEDNPVPVCKDCREDLDELDELF